MDDLLHFLLIRPIGRLFQWIGGTIRFLYGTLIRALGLTKRRSYSHAEYVNGPKEPDDVVVDSIGHRFNNRLLGLMFLVIMRGVLKNC